MSMPTSSSSTSYCSFRRGTSTDSIQLLRTVLPPQPYQLTFWPLAAASTSSQLRSSALVGFVAAADEPAAEPAASCEPDPEQPVAASARPDNRPPAKKPRRVRATLPREASTGVAF